MADQKIKPSTPRSNEQLAQAVRQPATALPGTALPVVDARVTLRRTDATLTSDHALWAAIRNRADAIGFDPYDRFINRVLCKLDDFNADLDEGKPVSDEQAPITAEDIGSPSIKDRRDDLLRVPSIYGVDAYNLLKLATQAFLLFETSIAVARPRNPDTGVPVGNLTDVVPGEEGRIGEQVTFDQIQQRLVTYLAPIQNGQTLPYLKRIVDALVGLDPERQTERLPYCFDLLRNRFKSPSLLELIWSYWNEQGMLVQTMNAICLRFQNRRGPSDRDPLANLEIDPLRPLNNIIWGFIQDEPYRLSIPRRAYEYDHQYGLRLQGKAAPELRSADSRSKFIEAFHNDPKSVNALVLRQMGCCFKVNDPLTRFLKIAPHFAILPDGRILQLHPITAYTGASNGFNKGSVAVEFAGNFPDTRGKWWNEAKAGKNQVTKEQIDAGRYLVRRLISTMGLTHILAQRQSSATRENDPGPDIWYHVGQWAVDNLGLKDGGPVFKVGDGNPIPDIWRNWGKAKPNPELEVEMDEEFDFSQLPQSVFKALSGGLEGAGIKLAIALGYRNENELTDMVFHARHPERSGAAITSGEPGYNGLISERRSAGCLPWPSNMPSRGDLRPPAES